MIRFFKNNLSSKLYTPISIAVIIVALFGDFSLAIEGFMQHEILDLSTQNSAIRKQYALKDSDIINNKQRLHITEKMTSKYELLSNSELVSRSLKIVENIRKIIHAYKIKNQELVTIQMKEISRENSNTEQSKIFSHYTQLDRRLYLEVLLKYERDFMVEAILLRDELFSRLKTKTLNKLDYNYMLYRHPTNHFGLNHVVNHLEAMSKSLKK